MSAFEGHVVFALICMVTGAVIWHFVHGKVTADIAAIKADVANLKTAVGSVSISALAAPLAPAVPSAPAAPKAA